MATKTTKKKTDAGKKRAPTTAGIKASTRSSAVESKEIELHLPSLKIAGFRGIQELVLPELGRVTLLVGKNSVGKSSVLEAARLYASAGDPDVMDDILRARESLLFHEVEEKGYENILDSGSLLFGHGDPGLGDTIQIGPAEKGPKLEIRCSELGENEFNNPAFRHLSRTRLQGVRCLGVSFDRKPLGKVPFISQKEGRIARRFSVPRRMWLERIWDSESAREMAVGFELFGPGLPTNRKIVSLYEELLMTPDEEELLKVLHFVNQDIEDLGSRGGGERYFNRRLIVKLKGESGQISLSTLGDGIVRLCGLAVALTNAKDGFLFIDEMENGIHHSLFIRLWEFVMRTAHSKNVQVIATTHSTDCVDGFAEACQNLEGIKGRLFRIDRKGTNTWAAPYTEEGLVDAKEAGIEVR